MKSSAQKTGGGRILRLVAWIIVACLATKIVLAAAAAAVSLATTVMAIGVIAGVVSYATRL